MSYKHVQQSWTQGCRQLCHWAASSLPRPLSSLRLELTALLRGSSHILPDLLDVVPASLWSTGPAPAVDKEPRAEMQRSPGLLFSWPHCHSSGLWHQTYQLHSTAPAPAISTGSHRKGDVNGEDIMSQYTLQSMKKSHRSVGVSTCAHQRVAWSSNGGSRA